MSCHTSPTHRELDILNLIAMGKRNSEIAATLHITVHTVETHLSNIYSKLTIRTRTEAARWYWEYSQKQSAHLRNAESMGR
jgi:DNA-binding NarL/FixJ family response regulator